MNDVELKQLLAKRIRRYMNRMNIDQRELAKRAGLSEVSLSRYITGHRKPTYDIVIRIAQALNCLPGDLLNIDEIYEY